MAATSAWRFDAVTVVRLTWAGALLVAPATCVGALGGTDSRGTRLVARILGARHAVQGGLELRRSPLLDDLGTATDVVHSISALVLAALDRPWRRMALADAAVAAGFAAAGVVAGRDDGSAG